jgi:hypothetical protein
VRKRHKKQDQIGRGAPEKPDSPSTVRNFTRYYCVCQNDDDYKEVDGREASYTWEGG